MGDGVGEHATALRPHCVRADSIEDELLGRFTAHSVFREIAQIEQDAFLEICCSAGFSR